MLAVAERYPSARRPESPCTPYKQARFSSAMGTTTAASLTGKHHERHGRQHQAFAMALPARTNDLVMSAWAALSTAARKASRSKPSTTSLQQHRRSHVAAMGPWSCARWS